SVDALTVAIEHRDVGAAAGPEEALLTGGARITTGAAVRVVEERVDALTVAREVACVRALARRVDARRARGARLTAGAAMQVIDRGVDALAPTVRSSLVAAADSV